MDAEDEDVIFENSAIHQAMKETGAENIDTEPMVSKDKRMSDQETFTSNDNDGNKTQRIPTNFFTRMFLSESEIISVTKSYQKKTLDRLMSSPLLSSDEKHFLQSFMDEEINDEKVSEKHSEPSTGPHLNFMRMLVFYIGLCLVSLVLCVMAYNSAFLPDFILMMGIDSPVFYIPMFTTLGLAVVFCLLKCLLHYKLCHDIEKMDCIIQDFEKSAGRLSQIVQKCIRHFRESDFVARGFTFASLSSSSNSDTNLLTHIDKLCPEFRTCLFNGNAEVMGHLKDSYRYLTDSVPLIVDFNYVDVGKDQLLKYQTKSSSDGASISEDLISTSDLALSKDFLNIHLSTFMRRLVLSFYTNNYRDVLVNPYLAVSRSVQTCQKSIDSFTCLLSKNHSFYRSVHLSAERPKKSGDQPKSKKSKSPLDAFYVCVNSLDLHLQSVFNKTRDLTVHLEIMIEDQSKDPTVESIDAKDRTEWEETLKQIKTGLDSCKSCYDEGIKLLAQTKSKQSSKDILEPSDSDSQEPSSTTKEPDNTQKHVIIIPDSEPVIEDQVFEAVIDSDVEEEEPVRPSYTVEQKAQIRQKREDLTRFKQELKAVVDHRAISQRKREEIALARTRGESSSTPSSGLSENDENVTNVDGNVENELTSSVKSKDNLEKSPEEKTQPVNNDWERVFCHPGKSEALSLDENRHGEKYSMLAAKLDSADSDKLIMTSTNTLPPWLSLAEKHGAATDSSQSSQSHKSKHSSSRSQQSSQALPYDEGWRSSIERSKARHWEMCEKIIQENKLADSDSKNSDSTQPSRNDLDTSSFVDISSSDDLLFYPIDTEAHVEDRASTSIRPIGGNDSSSSNSQILCPSSVDPEEEGFRNMDGAYVSRHNFTASGRNSVLHKALRDLERRNVHDLQDEDGEEQMVHRNPNRKRHRAEKQPGTDTVNWVNISHVEFVSGNGNQYELFRQKNMNSKDIATHNPIPSPDPCSSLNSSLALMAAARAKHFNLGVEEQFNDDGDADDNYEALCTSGANGDLSREMIQSEVA